MKAIVSKRGCILSMLLSERSLISIRGHSTKLNSLNLNFQDIILNQDLYRENTGEELKNRGFLDRKRCTLIKTSNRNQKSSGQDARNMITVDQEFREKVEELKVDPIMERIQHFVGNNFPLLTEEKLCICWGLSNIRIYYAFERNIEGTGKEIKKFPYRPAREEFCTEKIREIGKNVFDLHWKLSTIFANEHHLSSPSEMLAETVHAVDNNRDIIPLFMTANSLYNCIQGFRGAMKGGAINDFNKYLETKSKILNSTSIGSFYTLIGIIYIKFGQLGLEKVIYPKIIQGTRGITSIVMKELMKTRK